MSTLTKAQRDKLPESDFGDPKARLFPIVDQDDVDSAAHLVGKASNHDAVKARIIAIARRKGLKLPDAWQDGDRAKYTATFAGEPVEDGEYVVYPAAKLFECGDYPDKAFSLTPEEVLAASQDFQPVKIDLGHGSFAAHPLEGRLGEVRQIALADDGWTVTGSVAIPKWLDALLGEGERKLSAAWHRATKRLDEVSLVNHPRISDAALMAAFSASQEPPTDPKPPDGAAAISTPAKETHRMPTLKERIQAWFAAMPDDLDLEEPEKPNAGAEAAAEALKAAKAEVTKFAEENRKLRAEGIAKDAATFADKAIAESRAFPAEKAALVALYTQAATDDTLHGAVTFAEGQTTSRVALLEQQIAARPAHDMTAPLGTDGKRLAAPNPATSTFNGEGADGKPDPKKVDELLGYTEIGQDVLKARQNGAGR